MERLSDSDPRTIGEFEVVGRLGAGGMGQVYLGRSRSGRAISIKVIRSEYADDPTFRERFAREVAAARTVGGFWTASVVAADPDARQPWLATEYIAGPSLHAAVAANGPLALPAAKALAARLAEALHAICEAGLVHRDLKPANVLLAADGPRVIDFGISRAFRTVGNTQTAVIGTPSYMSPEQIRGEPLTPASDVFSFGSTLVYALTGSGPFDHGASDGVMYRVVAEAPHLVDVPPELADLVRSCLAKEPAARPTATRLVTQLGPDAGAVLTPLDAWRPAADVDVPRFVRGAAAVPNPRPSTLVDAAGRTLLTQARARGIGPAGKAALHALGWLNLLIAAGLPDSRWLPT